MKKINYSIKLLALISLVFTILSFSVKIEPRVSYSLKGKTFRIDGNGFEKRARKTYTLSDIEKEKGSKRFIYGHFIQFNDSTFQSYYRAPCGNDCFTDVQGKYKFLSRTSIQIEVLKLSKHGDCLTPKDYDKGDFGIYNVSIENNTIKLTKK